jgi:hypothetical protein
MNFFQRITETPAYFTLAVEPNSKADKIESQHWANVGFQARALIRPSGALKRLVEPTNAQKNHQTRLPPHSRRHVVHRLDTLHRRIMRIERETTFKRNHTKDGEHRKPHLPLPAEIPHKLTFSSRLSTIAHSGVC